MWSHLKNIFFKVITETLFCYAKTWLNELVRVYVLHGVLMTGSYEQVGWPYLTYLKHFRGGILHTWVLIGMIVCIFKGSKHCWKAYSVRCRVNPCMKIELSWRNAKLACLQIACKLCKQLLALVALFVNLYCE